MNAFEYYPEVFQGHPNYVIIDLTDVNREFHHLSYAAPSNDPDQALWGVAVIEAPTNIDALQRSAELGLFPGAQVLVGPACPACWRPRPEFVNVAFPGDGGLAFAQLDLEEWAEHHPVTA